MRASEFKVDRAPAGIAARLLPWYRRHARRLPWRTLPGEGFTDPYRVWLSEIMLQQTTVATVGPYFTRFLERWPTVERLAAAPREDVLSLWAGLGYYARARNMHRCARIVADELKGRFPDNESDLRALPGIGPYTAAAIAAIAFGRKATVVDGNVERVIARLFALEEPLPSAKPKLRSLAAELTPDETPGDYAQAMMDLGATVCLPRNPKCLLCPLNDVCAARAAGIEAQLPRKAPKPDRPTRYAVAFYITRSDGALLLRRRPDQGMLGGMMEVPSTPWRETPWDEAEARANAPAALDWRPLPGIVRHGFTHFHFEVTTWAGLHGGDGLSAEGRWVLPDALGGEALPTVMRKIIRHGLTAGAEAGS
jgi:A/G-specific adenine glycosylase